MRQIMKDPEIECCCSGQMQIVLTRYVREKMKIVKGRKVKLLTRLSGANVLRKRTSLQGVPQNTASHRPMYLFTEGGTLPS
jgi:hypothetical protein